MREQEQMRFKCDNVYDILRGAIVYSNMELLLAGAKAIAECEDICIEKFKDRFTPGMETAGGWRDLVFNGRFVDDPNEHKFEIQVHLDNLCGIRNNMGPSIMFVGARLCSSECSPGSHQLQ